MSYIISRLHCSVIGRVLCPFCHLVGRFVCLSIPTVSSEKKSADFSEMLFGMMGQVTSGGPKQACIRWGVSDTAWEGENLVDTQRECGIGCAKKIEPIELPFG